MSRRSNPQQQSPTNPSEASKTASDGIARSTMQSRVAMLGWVIGIAGSLFVGYFLGVGPLLCLAEIYQWQPAQTLESVFEHFLTPASWMYTHVEFFQHYIDWWIEVAHGKKILLAS